ncbi:unnamed protein product [Leptosia nina]|uniref:Myrosinase 1-like n=1 Tax=Leptosia nina TaxID=320188 RepID=A0AAV1J2B9_9NEOP
MRILLLSLTISFARSGKFPRDFLFGTSTSSYQIEGAWNEDGKGESLWDRVTHAHPEWFVDHSTGDVATDAYHHLDRDIRMMKKLGVNSYRFSLSWPRILPHGYTNVTNIAGIAYYDLVIDSLLSAEIVPIVTMYHWELPINLQKLGGWNNPESVTWFTAYADFVMSLYAHRIKYWLTLNEAEYYCDKITTLELPEGYIDPERAPFECTKNHLLAHAQVYKLFNERYRSWNNGVMSMSNMYGWYESASGDEEEQRVTQILLQYTNGRFSHPLYSKEGGWPPLLVDFMDTYSKDKGYNTSLLPPFTDEEKELIRGSADFLAINQYFTFITQKSDIDPQEMRFATDEESWWGKMTDTLVRRFDKITDIPMKISNYAPGMRRLINWCIESYGDWDILITENGYSSGNRTVEDVGRIQFLQSFLGQILLSITEDSHNVIGYTFWSLMDNFEWWSGYTIKFGLFDIDFNDPNRHETMRSSAAYYRVTLFNAVSSTKEFPPGFMFGAATSSYQVEGSWNKDGRVSIANHIMWFEPETPRDKGIADLTMDYAAGRYTHPIFSSKGGWPPSIERFMWIESLKEGYNTSRLPEFTSAEKKFIRGTADFFGLNYYTSRIVRRAKPGENLDETILSLLPYSDTYIGLHPDSYSSAALMFVMYPKGLRQTLSWIKRTCGNPSILITENGYPTSGLETEDYNRLKALRDHLEQVNLSIYEDGVNVVGYTFWSLLDNFEWLSGYTLRFGLYQIDFQDPELTRVPRLSAKYFACVIQNNCVEIPNDCFNMNPTKRVKRQILSNINKITNLPNISKLPNASNLPKIPKLPSPEKIANSVELMQEVVENRKCIIKVMGMAAKFMRLMNND